MNLPQQLLAVVLLLAASTVTPAAESAARWNPRTTNWNVNPRTVIGDWGFDRPGYPTGLYLQGVTVPEGQKVTNPVIYDNDVLDDVFDDELAMVMASKGEMNLVGLIVTPVLTDGWGFSKPEWIRTAHAARRLAEHSGLRMDRIPPITVGTEAPNEKAGENKDSAGARLYIRLIHEQFARDPQRPLLVNIGGQGATLASAYTLAPTIANHCLVYYTDLRVYNGHYQWASRLIAKHFRVVSWGDDHWWITKPGQNQWRVLPRPERAEGKDNDANSGEWRQWSALHVPLLDHMVKQFQTRGEYCRGERKGDGYLDGTFLQAWLPGIFDDAALQEIRGGQVLHVTRFTASNEDRVRAFANQRLLNPQAYRGGARPPETRSAANAAVESTVLPYPAYPGARASERFEVSVNGQPVFVHHHPTHREKGSGDMHYAHFAMSGKTVVRVKNKSGAIRSCDIRPLAYAIKPTIEGDTATFELDRPRYGIVFVNEPAGYDSSGLMLFAEAPEVNPPKLGDAGVRNLLDYGADPSGARLATEAINRAIEDAARQPGGATVFLPKGGIYRSGTVMMKSGVTLYVEAGAVLRGSDDPKDYPVISNGSHWGNGALVFFDRVENSALRGRGTIDANGYPRLYSQLDPKDGSRKRSIYGYKLGQCRNIRFDDLILANCCQWTVHLFDSDHFATHNIKILNRKVQYNEDVYDFDVSRHIRVENGFALTMDDFFAIKGTPGTLENARRRDVEDIVVKGFVGYGYDTGLALGYSGEAHYTSVKDVHLEDYHAVSCRVDYAVWIAFTPNPPTGYAEALNRPLSNFTFKNCTFEEGGGIYISAGESKLTGFTFDNCSVLDTRRPCILEGRNVERMAFRNLRIGGQNIRSADDFKATDGRIEVPATFESTP